MVNLGIYESLVADFAYLSKAYQHFLWFSGYSFFLTFLKFFAVVFSRVSDQFVKQSQSRLESSFWFWLLLIVSP
jgi:hypothetical protein